MPTRRFRYASSATVHCTRIRMRSRLGGLSMVETFDGWDKTYTEMEKEDNPFRLLFLIFKFMLKATWMVFKFVMIGIRNVILWLMKRQKLPQQQVYYPVNQAS
jgi:hypothetical protein